MFSRCFLRNSFISLGDPSVSLDRIQGFFPFLLLSVHCTPFRGVTLSLLKPFTISFFFALFLSFYLLLLYRYLPLVASSLSPTFLFPFAQLSLITILSFFFFLRVSKFILFSFCYFCHSFSRSSLILFLSYSRIFLLFLLSSIFYVDPSLFHFFSAFFLFSFTNSFSHSFYKSIILK